MAMITGDVEFIKNRSFEIAWAVFRCANIIKQPKLKIELENASVDIIANLGVVDNLEKLEQLIRLAEVVEEIGKINAFILFREIDNLKEAVRQWNSAIRQEKEKSSAIDRIFAKVPAPLFDINNPSINSGQVSSAKLTTSSSAIVRQDERSSAILRQAQDKSEKSSAIFRQPQDDEDRQNRLFKKVQELGKTTTKELLASFPDISERTVRFYLLRLCDQGLVSRIGSTGPGSYYVAK
ncbi:MAG: hypothetical protein NUV83_00425 [Candidatus Wolfebacteria bacterium]|nr:hypothetical protein [Candidatus Wolfebacteria bacterium]